MTGFKLKIHYQVYIIYKVIIIATKYEKIKDGISRDSIGREKGISSSSFSKYQKKCNKKLT
jgi:hypothetical protein